MISIFWTYEMLRTGLDICRGSSSSSFRFFLKFLFKLRIKMGAMQSGNDSSRNLLICWDSYEMWSDWEVTEKCATQADGWQLCGLFWKTQHLCVFTAPALWMNLCEVNMSVMAACFQACQTQSVHSGSFFLRLPTCCNELVHAKQTSVLDSGL